MLPERLDRYQLTTCVADGADVRVWEALDVPLRRTVRVACVAASEPGRRHDLLAQARAVAALSNPAFCHIYEVFPADADIWIVTENLHGRSIGTDLEEGPLPVSEVARIGETVALALQDARRTGFMPSALEPRHLVRTASGRIAVDTLELVLRAAREGDDGTPRPGHGPSGGGLPGPDFDLRLLGRLLAALAGTAPRGTREDGDPRSAPVPAAMAELIRRCFADDDTRLPSMASAAAALRSLRRAFESSTTTRPAVHPRPRRRRLLIGAGIVAVLAVLAAAVWLGLRRPAAPLDVAVMPVQAAVIDDEAMVVSAVEEAAVTRLGQLTPARVAPPRSVNRAVEEGARASGQIATLLGVQEFVEGSVTQAAAGGPVRIGVTRVAAHGGRLVWSGQVDVHEADLGALRAAVAELVDAAFAARGAPLPEPVPERALRAYLQAWEASRGSGRSIRGVDAEDRAEAALAAAPDLLDAALLLFDLRLEAFRDSRDPAALEALRKALRRAAAIAGDNAPAVVLRRVDAALAGGQDDEAAEIARALTEREPARLGAWLALGRSLAACGSWSEAEKAYDHAHGLCPSWDILDRIAACRMAQGDTHGARAALEPIVAAGRDRPFAIARTAALAEAQGDLEPAAMAWLSLARSRGLPADLARAGDALLAAGHPAKAAELLQRAADAAPGDPKAEASLALALHRAGRAAAARPHFARCAALADRILDGGTRDVGALRARATCRAFIGEPAAALADAEAEVALAPRDPRGLFSAALVAGASGAPERCVDWTRRALRTGAPAAWFTAPEFVPMWSDPAFQSLFPD